MTGQQSSSIPQDYHIHTHHSVDSHVTMTQMCRAAIANGTREIAFSDHLDNHPKDFGREFYNPEKFFAELETTRVAFKDSDLTIRASVELGEVHRFTEAWQPVIAQWPYDIVIGSLHWVGEYSVFDQEYLSEHAVEETIGGYFTELAAMARHGGFEILGHPDIIKRAGYVVYGKFDITSWEDYVRPVWQACIDNEIAVEINTSGLRQPVAQSFPTVEALRWYKAMGGERLTLGSDAHRAETCGYGLASALDIARSAGFTRVCQFEGRKMIGWLEF